MPIADQGAVGSAFVADIVRAVRRIRSPSNSAISSWTRRRGRGTRADRGRVLDRGPRRPPGDDRRCLGQPGPRSPPAPSMIASSKIACAVDRRQCPRRRHRRPTTRDRPRRRRGNDRRRDAVRLSRPGWPRAAKMTANAAYTTTGSPASGSMKWTPSGPPTRGRTRPRPYRPAAPTLDPLRHREGTIGWRSGNSLPAAVAEFDYAREALALLRPEDPRREPGVRGVPRAGRRRVDRPGGRR